LQTCCWCTLLGSWKEITGHTTEKQTADKKTGACARSNALLRILKPFDVVSEPTRNHLISISDTPALSGVGFLTW